MSEKKGVSINKYRFAKKTTHTIFFFRRSELESKGVYTKEDNLTKTKRCESELEAEINNWDDQIAIQTYEQYLGEFRRNH